MAFSKTPRSPNPNSLRAGDPSNLSSNESRLRQAAAGPVPVTREVAGAFVPRAFREKPFRAPLGHDLVDPTGDFVPVPLLWAEKGANKAGLRLLSLSFSKPKGFFPCDQFDRAEHLSRGKLTRGVRIHPKTTLHLLFGHCFEIRSTPDTFCQHQFRCIMRKHSSGIISARLRLVEKILEPASMRTEVWVGGVFEGSISTSPGEQSVWPESIIYGKRGATCHTRSLPSHTI